VIWFVQAVGEWFHVIDCLEASGAGVEFYASALQEKKYVYRRHVWPHDGKAKVFGPQETRQQIGERLLMPKPEVLPVGDLRDGIQAARSILKRCKFDRKRCKDGLSGLRSYRHQYDQEHKRWRNEPEHDWASNFADGFRTLAVHFRGPGGVKRPSSGMGGASSGKDHPF
jgi:hypothetical protein